MKKDKEHSMKPYNKARLQEADRIRKKLLKGSKLSESEASIAAEALQYYIITTADY